MDEQLTPTPMSPTARQIAMDRSAPKSISVARGVLAALVALYAVASLTGLSESVLHRSANHVVAGGLLIAAAAICAARSVSISAQRMTWGDGALSRKLSSRILVAAYSASTSVALE